MEYYFNNTIKNYTIAVGSLFKELYTQKYDAAGKIMSTPKVLLKYWPKIHWYERNTDGKILDQYGINAIVPMLSYNLTAITPDVKRQTSKYEILQPSGSLLSPSDPNYSPISAWSKNATPYNFTYEFIAWSDQMTEMSQMIEQILPKFNPTMNFHIMEAPALGLRRTARAIFSTNSWNTKREYDIKSDRLFEYSFNLVIEGYLYPPITDQGLIQTVITNHRDLDTEGIFDTTTISSSNL